MEKPSEAIGEINIVEYCKYCGLPVDYCEYGQCIQNKKTEHVEALETDKLSSNLDTSLNIDEAQESETSKKKNDESKGTRKKKTRQNIITIKVESRARRKSVTVVSGLEMFDIQLNEAAKRFAKQFSCGASVVKGSNGKPDHIDVQGDFDVTIAEFILKTYPHIDASSIILHS
ncbi:putative metal binding and RNA binding domain-containing protein [Cryptosporidium canis]|uniref:Metal binding and RNA binding domain-containing protein n=1 Tax=Cryptosporidium canis TaxID=195482 RepID=A0ABQ8PBA4_9CRYT|nr:putative metal binding and RNA binding domain-containing protein [Cryptosporidium canis]KAJ1615157.1 putative metal binding and RNA binding domain-containing protein [Cryptosporidium canis]